MANPDERAPPIEETETEKARAAQPAQANVPPPSKKRRKRTSKTQIITQFTIRDAPWAYVNLRHLTSKPGSTPTLDAVTARLHLTAALQQFLGLHGTAIPVDILRLDGMDVWIRIPAQDESALVAAVGGWVSSNGEGWRVTGTSSWDARANSRQSGQDLFTD